MASVQLCFLCALQDRTIGRASYQINAMCHNEAVARLIRRELFVVIQNVHSAANRMRSPPFYLLRDLQYNNMVQAFYLASAQCREQAAVWLIRGESFVITQKMPTATTRVQKSPLGL